VQYFEDDYQILTHDADAFGLWRPDAAFRLMQEIAGAHSALLGMGRDDLMRTRGCVWMLARAHLEVLRYPRLYDTLHAKTWYGTPGRVTYLRYITVSDDAGARIANIATVWVVAELASRRILLPGKALLPFPPAPEEAPPLPEPGKVRPQKAGKPQLSERTPRYSDLDINGHMNNASYIAWILDLFPMEYHGVHRIKNIRIGYSTEARPGEPVEMALYESGMDFETIGRDKKDGHIVFEARGDWQRCTSATGRG
jgi:acyl-ACP thioesterase